MNGTISNVYLVYLVDFGSVQTIASTEGATITIVGTYGYMPPEKFGGQTTTASDLYIRTPSHLPNSDSTTKTTRTL